MPFYARDAARDASITVKHIHVYIEKTMEKQRNQIQKMGEKIKVTGWKLLFIVLQSIYS